MILCFGAGIISSFLLFNYNKSNKKLFLVLSFLPLFILSALRYGIGYDYLKIYVPMFNFISNGVKVSWDIGAIWICKIINIFSNDYVYFFVITSFLILLFTYKGILKLSSYPALCLLLFVLSGEYISSFNIIRQYIALSIFIYSLNFILEKKMLKYIACILVASLFHNSAIVLIPIYFLCQLKTSMMKQIAIIIICGLALPFISDLVYSILPYFKYSSYLNTDYNAYDPSYVSLILSILSYSVMLLFYKKNKSDKKYKLFLNINLLYILFAILSFKLIASYRLLVYFRFVQYFGLANLTQYIEKPKNKLLYMILLVAFFSMYTLIGGYVLKWYPTEYVSIFNR